MLTSGDLGPAQTSFARNRPEEETVVSALLLQGDEESPRLKTSGIPDPGALHEQPPSPPYTSTSEIHIITATVTVPCHKQSVVPLYLLREVSKYRRCVDNVKVILNE